MKRVEQVLIQAFRGKRLPGTERSIIVLKHKSAYNQCVRRLAAAGMKPIKQARRSRMICCHTAKEADRIALRLHPHVAYIEKDHPVQAHDLRQAPPHRSFKLGKRGASLRIQAASSCPPKAPWNVCRVKAPPVWPRTKGQGVKVGIIDTGIAKHPDLRIAGGVNTMGGRSFADDNGHGTHVSGIAAATGKQRLFGVAPRVDLYAVKALDALGAGYVSDIVEGIDWSIGHGMRVINMSLGLTANSRALREAVARARRKGIVIAASAGNSGVSSGGIDAPARYPGVLAVAATTRNNRVASFSSRGKGIALAAPGVNILSTYLRGKYVRMSGTSMSSPHVTGGAALLRALKPTASASQIRRLLKQGALPLPGGRNAVGSGLLQVATSAKKLSFRPCAVGHTSSASQRRSVLLKAKTPSPLIAGR